MELVKPKDPILKKICEEVKEVNSDVKKIMDDMVHVCKNKERKLVAIAAPQVGISKRIIVVFHNKCIIKLANPIILKTSGKQRFLEGCGTVGEKQFDTYGFVDRPYYVKIEAIAYNNRKVIIEAEEILAIKIQHEIDHLNGIQFIDSCRLVDGKTYSFDSYQEVKSFRKEHPLEILEEPCKRLENFVISFKID